MSVAGLGDSSDVHNEFQNKEYRLFLLRVHVECIRAATGRVSFGEMAPGPAGSTVTWLNINIFENRLCIGQSFNHRKR